MVFVFFNLVAGHDGVVAQGPKLLNRHVCLHGREFVPLHVNSNDHASGCRRQGEACPEATTNGEGAKEKENVHKLD
jgi:hypothetical protein